MMVVTIKIVVTKVLLTDVITITWQDPESTDKRRVISYNMIPLLALGLVCVTG